MAGPAVAASAHHGASTAKTSAGARTFPLAKGPRRPRDKKPPSAPSRLAVTATAETSLSLAWKRSRDNVRVVRYRLYRNRTLAGATSKTSYVLSGLRCRTKYKLSVQAVDAAGNHSRKASIRGSTKRCQSQQPPPPPSVTPPTPPSAYPLPLQYTLVASSSQLANLLGNSIAENLVLVSGGSFGQTSPFAVNAADKLYAQSLLGAFVTSGLSVGGSFPGGFEVHGVAFNVSGNSRTDTNSIVYTWGSGGQNTRIEDSSFEGNLAVNNGVNTGQAQGVTLHRLRFNGFLHNGVYAEDNDPSSLAQLGAITDLQIGNVRANPPGSTNGADEYGIQIGNRASAPTERIAVDHVHWGGFWTGSAANGNVLRDLRATNIERTASEGSTGLYMERYSRNVTIERFDFSGSRMGVICEWDGGTPGNAACHGDVIQDGTISSRVAGVYLDIGTERTTVRRLSFIGQNCADIVDDHGTGNSYSDNNYSQLAPGAVPVKPSACPDSG
jgi:chitodextrinase